MTATFLTNKFVQLPISFAVTLYISKWPWCGGCNKLTSDSRNSLQQRYMAKC